MELRLRFATRSGERDYDRDLAALMRADRFDQAEARLRADLAGFDDEIAVTARALDMDATRIGGWEALQAAIFRPFRDGGLPTAVWLDLSNYGDPPPDLRGNRPPQIEVSLYSDKPFAFSGLGREEILAHNERYGVPWQGCFEDIDAADLSIGGLEALNEALLRANSPHFRRPTVDDGGPLDPAPAAYVAHHLADWLRSFAFQRAARLRLREQGLARSIPVILGSHDAGPFIETVHFPAPSAESAAQAAARMEQNRAAERAAWAREKRRKLEETAQSMREMRKIIRAAGFWPSERVRRLRDLYDAQERRILSLSGVTSARPSGPIADDAAFEAFLQRHYIDARMGEAASAT